MFDTCQLLLTSDISSNLGSACVWDYKTGTTLHCYKNGGVLNPHTLTLIGEDYFIAAERAKPVIHVWQVNSQETLKNFKIICSGQVTALAASPGGQYCVAGIGEQLHMWQIATGKLLAVVSRHFQPITKIVFTPDASYVVSAGEDGLILVWPLNRLVSQTSSGQIEPLHVLSDHSLPVRDMCISVGAVDTRISTVSADCTLKVHQLVSGELLLSAVFDESLTALNTIASGAVMFIGTTSGNIHELSLLNPPRSKVFHVDSGHGRESAFCGHTKYISGLSVSADGLTLASGSADGLVIIWHIPSRQKIKTIPHGNSVNNVLFIPAIKNIFVDELRQKCVFHNFQRSLITDDENQKSVQVIHREDLNLPFSEEFQSSHCVSENSQSQISSYQSEIDKLKTINHQLYQFSLDRILSNTDFKIVKPKDGSLKSNSARKKKKTGHIKQSEPVDSVNHCNLKRKCVE